MNSVFDEEIMRVLIEAKITREIRQIEEACREAIESGTDGVFIHRRPDGTCDARSTPFVPYGQIVEYRDPGYYFAEGTGCQ